MTFSSPAQGPKEVLLCPGPVLLSPGVKRALVNSEIGHRDASFAALFARLRRNAGLVLGASTEHSVLFLSGPATSGIEAVCASLLDGPGTVVVPVNGTFGARIVEILEVHGIRCRAIDFGFARPFDLARLESELASLGAEAVAVAMTQHETSCGFLNPVASVCALAKRLGLRTFVDATSSAGAEDLDVARDGVDACVTSSGKCLHAPPGVAVVCARRDWLADRRGRPVRSFALDLRRYHDIAEAASQTPFTPVVPVFVALDRAVRELLDQGGVAERRRQYRHRRALLAAGLARVGLSLLPLPAGSEAASVLTVALPAGLRFDELYGAMRERGYVIYGAKPPLATRYFQLSVMGELADADLEGFLAALESVVAGTARRYRAASA